eukprot:6521106-Pyramimonas_sp.AAC.2
MLLPRGVIKGRPAPSVKAAVTRALIDNEFKETTNEYNEQDSKWKLKNYKTKWREVGLAVKFGARAMKQSTSEGGLESTSY